MQNGEIWIPATPEKPVLQRGSSAESEIPETQIGEGNWQDLLGIYTGLLQNEAASGRPQKFNPNVVLGPNGRERSVQGVAPVETYNRLQQNYNPTAVVPVSTRVQSSRDVAPVGNYNRLPWNFNSSDRIGINIMDRNIQDVRTLQHSRSLNQNAGGVGSSVQNVGEAIPPQKVNSLAELMGMRSATRAPLPNLAPNESTYIMGRPTSICLHPQGERNQMAYASVGGKHQQNHILHAIGDGDGYNLHETPNNNWKHDDIRLEPTEVGQVDSSSRPSVKISPTTPNARKRKSEKEKAEPFNWDTLRKQVQQAGTIGRSREAMDSLDYEALRNADVREISDTIKERGMNNMLAERMKDFLNRIVRDHERIDLEWLRDVPPEKSKDYLLSIRGLGLKSVECVRLLTLHHLAFPVRTPRFTSATERGMSTEDIQYCFWKGFVCVRGFDQKTRAPRPLKARLHLPASKMAKQNE
ncbi:UNVERIFIED_CONTAM: protein ROS1A [Sesamum angustifolium]|uniref:Protein ROS1A n=1 Tax=Sesamum angustifolium TaxID=2727405 RepID=A0AAW2LDX7_9LAMI